MQRDLEGGKGPQGEDILNRAQCVQSMHVVSREQLNGASFRKRAVGQGWKDRDEGL